jgi:hypothetical protein
MSTRQHLLQKQLLQCGTAAGSTSKQSAQRATMFSHDGDACAQSAAAQQLTSDIAGKQHGMQEPPAWSLHVFLASTRQLAPSDAIHTQPGPNRRMHGLTVLRLSLNVAQHHGYPVM